MIEGEEEIGSVSLNAFCPAYRERLKHDVILVSDTTMISPEIPSITVGLRGISYMEVKVTGPNRDLHSGLYGGAVANPAVVLSKMIAGLFDKDNRITIPGFYDDVLVLSEEERKLLNQTPFNVEKYKSDIAISDIYGEAGYSTIERVGTRPALDVNGIWGGYTGEGSKTVLPSYAQAKISMRIVPNQKAEKIAEIFRDYFISIAPASVKVDVTYLHGGEPYVSPVSHPGYLAASRALNDTYGRMPIPSRSGGSIPIISFFEKVFGTKSILLGFGLGSDAIHSPNENYPLEQFYNGIKTIPQFYKYYVEEMTRKH